MKILGDDSIFDISDKIIDFMSFFDINSKMQAFQELGEAVAKRRKAMGMRQGVLARLVGLSQASLSRFERGRSTGLGSRKLLAILAVLGMELQFTEKGQAGSLDELRKERST